VATAKAFTLDWNTERRAWFWEQATPVGGCWIYLAVPGVPRTDYARIQIGERRAVAVHRIAYYLVHGGVPTNREVCHRCDQPACIRPAHLFLGTHADNMHDMALKGRAGAKRRRQAASPPPPVP
jgi:hypothetical protein